MVLPPSYQLHLEILPSKIDPRLWAQTWDEALAFLESERLLRLEMRAVLGTTIPVLTRALSSKDESGRFLRVVADEETLTLGEAFTIYRKPPSTLMRSEGDIVWAEPGTARGWAVFGEDTEDAPYHGPLLAAATLFENAFPGAALVYGDLDPEAAELARRRAERGVGRALRPLVSMDARALESRLRGRYQGSALIEGVISRYLGRGEEGVATGLSAAPEAGRGWIKRVLRHPGRLKTYEIVSGWLLSGGALEELLYAASLDPDGPALPPEFLVLALAHAQVLIPPGLPERAQALLDRAPDRALASGLAPLLQRRAAPHLSLSSIERSLHRLFPGRGASLLRALVDHSAKLQEVLEDAVLLLQRSVDDRTQGTMEDDVSTRTLVHRAQAYWARPRGQRLSRRVEALGASQDREGLLRIMVSASARGLVLSERAWSWMVSSHDPSPRTRRLVTAAKLALWVHPDTRLAREVARVLEAPENLDEFELRTLS